MSMCFVPWLKSWNETSVKFLSTLQPFYYTLVRLYEGLNPHLYNTRFKRQPQSKLERKVNAYDHYPL